MPVIIREVHIRAEATGSQRPADPSAGPGAAPGEDREALIEAVTDAVLARLERLNER